MARGDQEYRSRSSGSPEGSLVVVWYWEKDGNVGKTWVTKYLAVMEDVCFLDGGKKVDLAHTYSKSKAKSV
jgi:hypothetical protein